MKIRYYASKLNTKTNTKWVGKKFGQAWDATKNTASFKSKIISDTTEVINRLNELLRSNRNSINPYTLIALENVDTGEQLEFVPVNIHDDDIMAMLHELVPSADIHYSVEYTRKYYKLVIDSIYNLMKDRILSFSKFEHVDFLELYNLKNTDLESEVIEKVANDFCTHIMNIITDFKNSDLHNMYNGYKILYNKIIISNSLDFLKENDNIPTFTEYKQAYKIFLNYLDDVSKIRDYANFVLK